MLFLNKVAHAQNKWEYLNQISTASGSVTRFSSLESVLGLAVNIALGTAISVSFIGTILSGIKFMQARTGDPRALDAAKSALIYSLVALFLSISAFTIVGIILTYVGIQDSNVFRIIPIPSGGGSSGITGVGTGGSYAK